MAGLGKKYPVMMSKRLAAVLDKLSKAALADLCIDLIRRMEGADAEEWTLAKAIDQTYLPPVVSARRQDA